MKDNWRKITIAEYYKIKDIFSSEKNDIEKQLEMIALLNDVTVEYLMGLSIPEFSKYKQDLSWIKDFPLTTKSKPPKKIDLCGDIYVVNTDMQNFCVAQYIDFQTFWAKEDMEKYYGNIIACFMIPEGKKYGEGYDTVELSNKIYNNLDIVTANEIVFFSLKESAKLMEDILIYLNLATRTGNKKMKKEAIAIAEMIRKQYIDGLTILTSTQQ